MTPRETISYADKPHPYIKCCCKEPHEHCWHCGQDKESPIHIMTITTNMQYGDLP